MELSRDRFFQAVVAGGALLCVLYALRPLCDPDFWWHLKTGEEMFRTGGLLSGNPFWFTGDAAMTARARMILHGYWLWELCYYAVYAGAGWWGILSLNLLLLLTLFGTVAWLLSRQALDAGIKGLLFALSLAAVAPNYYLERPQVYSFLFCLLLVAMLDRFRDRRLLSRWLFPLMLVWGNVHGGVIVGIGLLGLFLLGVAIQLRHERQQVVKCALWAGGGALCGLLNPAAVFALAVYGEGLVAAPLAMGEGTREFNSTLEFFKEGVYWMAGLWLLMVVHALALSCARKRWLADYLIFLVLLPASFRYMRNLAFFAVCLLPQTAYYLGTMAAARNRWVQLGARAGCALLLALMLLLVCKRQEFATSAPVSDFYPARLVKFVREAGISGNAFNDYDWGGFLLWELAPQTRLFIDGRNLDGRVYDHWLRIRWLSPRPVDGRPEYESLLDGYGVEYVIQKNFSKLFLTEPLVRSLLRSGGWTPVYQDETGYVVVRNLPKYQQVIERHRIEPWVFWTNILKWYDRRIALANEPRMYMGRGELNLYLGYLEAARRDLQIARQALGEDAYLQQLLKKAQL